VATRSRLSRPASTASSPLHLAGRIVEKIVEKYKEQGIGMSIGLSCISPGEIISLNDFIDTADRKMYEAKKAGGKQGFDLSMDKITIRGGAAA